MAEITLIGAEVENLRGYYSASLSFDRPRTVLVGPNNSGKTSLLRIVNWVLNDADELLLRQGRPLTADEAQLLLPARETRHRARRLTLRVTVGDKRSHRKFHCTDDGVATLRINVRLTPTMVVYVALGPPKRGEGAESSEPAVELLRRLRKSLRFVHIPSFRDGKSDKFNGTLHEALRARIEERALHASQAGAPKEHRLVAKKLEELEKLLLRLANPLWDEVSRRLPPGMTKGAVLDFDCDQATFLGFLESRLKLKVSTGEHDALAVPISELGSGLQSLLDLAFQDGEPAGTRVIIAAEEPEAFLHPSAQRTVAGRLFAGASENRKVVVTTHSPIVVEEARFGDVVLCRDHKFYEPSSVTVEDREEINTALLTGAGAEMVFGRSVLLVEGEGDRQFFERLRRRLAQVDDSGLIDRCFVVPVGSSTAFAPWLQLLLSYGDASDRPISWLAAPDGDAGRDIRRGFRDAGLPLKKEVTDDLAGATAAMNGGDLEGWRNAVQAVNDTCRATGAPLHLLLLDLEEAALGNAGPQTIAKLAKAAGWDDDPARKEALRRLGAKGFGGANGKKAPHLRALAGEILAPNELSTCVEECLLRWVSPAMTEQGAKDLLKRWKAR